jgi:HD-like signal output (HDOD) protein
MKLAAVLERVEVLPPMPGTAVRLLNAVQDPDVDLAHVARWIEHDPSTTANLLHLCNSPFYGLRGQISSARQAVSLLGMKQVVQLALIVTSRRYLAPGHPGYDLAPGELLRNSVTAAIACELLALEVRYKDVAKAYTAGLLQDIGKIVMAEFVAPSKESIWALAEERSMGFEEGEVKLIGASHAEVGGILLARWGFPPTLVEAVRFHHAPARATLDPLLAKISHVGNALTMAIGVGLGADGLAYRLDEEALCTFGLSDETKLSDTMERLAAALDRMDDLLNTVPDESI